MNKFKEAAQSEACRKQHLISAIMLTCASAKSMKSSLDYQVSLSGGPIKILLKLLIAPNEHDKTGKMKPDSGFNVSQSWIISWRQHSRKGESVELRTFSALKSP